MKGCVDAKHVLLLLQCTILVAIRRSVLIDTFHILTWHSSGTSESCSSLLELDERTLTGTVISPEVDVAAIDGDRTAMALVPPDPKSSDITRFRSTNAKISYH